MKENRVLTTTKNLQYEMRVWDGENHSGIIPVCDKVLVLVDQALPRSRGGIIIPDAVGETYSLGSTTGILIAVGPQAFMWDSDRTTKWEGEKPEAGARICFEKYAGQLYDGFDGLQYRLMQDRCIAGTQGTAELIAADDHQSTGITGLSAA